MDNLFCSCLTSTRNPDGTHNGHAMIDPNNERPARDLVETIAVMDRCDAATTHAETKRLLLDHGLWAERSALMDIPMFDMLHQVRADSLHVLDGGITMRLLLYVACWVAKEKGWAALEVVNKRISGMNIAQEYKHFHRRIFKKAREAKAGNNSTTVTYSATWRCVEYEALIQQFVYAVTAYPEAAHVVIAWADLYKTIRDVAPTLFSIGTAFSE